MTLFRYPGGKSKIASQLALFFKDEPQFADVFAGGGSVFIEYLKRSSGLSARLVCINDLDYGVSSFWRCLFDKELRTDLFKLVVEVPVDLDSFYSWKEKETKDPVEAGFRTIFLNRTSFSGMMNNPIGGKGQKSKWGVGCRYNPDRIIREVNELVTLATGVKVIVSCMDFRDFIKSQPESCSLYLDPPYLLQGKSLYKHYFSTDDHADLAALLANRHGRWMLSYDDEADIRELYAWANICDVSFRYSINGKKENWVNKNELVVIPKEFEGEARTSLYKRDDCWRDLYCDFSL